MKRALTIYRGLIGAVVLLSGCSWLQSRLEDVLSQAQELSLRCEALDQNAGLDVTAEQLLRRIQVSIDMGCGKASVNCPDGIKQQLKALRDRIAELKLTDKMSKSIQDLETKLNALRQISEEIFNRENFQTQMAKAWKEVVIACKPSDSTARVDRIACNRSQVALFEVISDALKTRSNTQKSVEQAVDDVRTSYDSFRMALIAASPKFRQEGSQTLDMVDQLIGNAQKTVANIADKAIVEFNHQFLDWYLPQYTANRMMGFIERQMEPLDRLVERGDETLLYAPSLLSEFGARDIQNVFDTFYVKHVRALFPSTRSAVAFARVACDRLQTPTSGDRPVMLVTSFIYKSITLASLEQESVDMCKSGQIKGISIAESMDQRCDEWVKEIRLQFVRSDNGNLPQQKYANLADAFRRSIVEGKAKANQPADEAAKAQAIRSLNAEASASNMKAPDSVSQNSDKSQIPDDFTRCVGIVNIPPLQLASYASTPLSRQARPSEKLLCSEWLLSREQNEPATGNPSSEQSKSEDLNIIQAELRKLRSDLDRYKQGSNEDRSIKLSLSMQPPAGPILTKAQGFCSLVRSSLPGVSCLAGEAAELDVSIVFPSGGTQSLDMVPLLRTLASTIAIASPMPTTVTVLGAASQTRITSVKLKASLEGPSAFGCDVPEEKNGGLDSDNRRLAKMRADWASGVMAARAPSLKSILRSCASQDAPMKGNHGYDRRISMRLLW